MVLSTLDISDKSMRHSKELSNLSNNNDKNIQQLNDFLQICEIKVNNLMVTSKKINDITEAISKIAQQTNLLAINTSIEAARAGDTGKGFSIIANEIKSLSDNTSNKAKEIELIINNTKKEIHELKEQIYLCSKASSIVSESNTMAVQSIHDINMCIEELEGLMKDFSKN